MGIDATLTGNRLDCADWNKIFAAWAEEDAAPYNEPVFSDADSDGNRVAHLWRPGSIRGVLLRLEPQQATVSIRINALASQGDWRTAFSVLKAALEDGGGQLELNGESFGPEDLASTAAVTMGTREFLFGAQALGKHDDGVIPMGAFSLPTPFELLRRVTPDTIEDAESVLAEMVERYASAFREDGFLLPNGYSVAPWALVPTLVPKEIDYIIFTLDESSGEHVELPLAKAIETLGERAEDVSPSYYLPGLDPAVDAELLADLVAAASGEPSLGEMPTKAAPSGSFDPSSPEGLSDICAHIVQSAFDNQEFATVEERLVGEGLDRNLVQVLMGGCAQFLNGMTSNTPPPEVLQTMQEQLEIPEELAMIIAAGAARGVPS